jgi:hypothetical protein
VRRRTGLTREENDIVGYAVTVAIGEGWFNDPDEIKRAQALLMKLNNEMEMEKS